MDAKTYQLQDILKPERRYLIPTFQRDYEWTADGQWRLLFEDLSDTADRLLAVRSEGAGDARSRALEQRVQPHFLGAVVLAGVPFSPGGVAPRSVIDGQQRLTTIQLLTRGVLDVLQEIGSDKAKSVRRMLFNPDDVLEQPEELYKLWPRRRDRDMWPTAMGDSIPDATTAANPATRPTNGDTHLYLQARQFFRAAARDYATDDTGALDPARAAALADALAGLFKLVVIDLDDNDDAQVIFEVLNGRQTPLSAIDLVKNLLFLRAELDEADVETLYDRYWAQFDDPWWKETIGRGHAARGRRDMLLSIWLTAATGTEANVGNLYRDARSYLDRGPGTDKVLRELDAFATGYREVYGALPVQDPQLATGYARIRALEITTAMPLLVWLRTLPADQLPLEEHVQAVRAIESWAMRRALLGWQTRGYGAHFVRALKAAKEASTTQHSGRVGSGDDIVHAIVGELQAGSLGWPSDADVTDGFVQNRFYGWISQPRIRLLLGAIDQHLRTVDPNEPPAQVDYDNLQVEHVMPQAWPQHWPAHGPDGQPVEPADDDPAWLTLRSARDRYVHRLGNLTLVTGSFNRGVSNLGWDTKREEFRKQKSLMINYDIADSATWDEDHIDDRARHLATTAITVWPGPDAFTSSPTPTA